MPESPTHWKDDRGYVPTGAERSKRGGDWALVYNVPCSKGAFVRIIPMRKCGHCGGKGRDPEFAYDPCSVCGKSGGLPKT